MGTVSLLGRGDAASKGDFVRQLRSLADAIESCGAEPEDCAWHNPQAMIVLIKGADHCIHRETYAPTTMRASEIVGLLEFAKYDIMEDSLS
jgi:hypothetical protein